MPNLIGWHSLGPSPGDVPEALSRYYRPLENQLGVPGRPLKVVIEEYGPGSGDFEGVPGTMIKHWAEFERYGVDFAAMGIYTNPGLLGNTLRRREGRLVPNAGWHMMNWYKAMAGNSLFVSRWDTRRYQASDGVATWDPAARTVTILAGGEDNDVDVAVLGLGQRGLGTSVRVRLEMTWWDKDPHEADRRIERGGDPKTGVYSVFDKVMALDAAGNLTVPIHRMQPHHGYRIVISAAEAPAAYAAKYEAERAQLSRVVVHGGARLASNDSYVGGIDFADSAVTFAVDVASAGIYQVMVRYANNSNANATHRVAVNGTSQGTVSYPPTEGWANSELRIVTKNLALSPGRNLVRFSRDIGYAELDYLDVRPGTHRYEAEYATVTNARIARYGYNEFPDLVAGIDFPDSAVEFSLDVPRTGDYRLAIGYGNGLAGTATHRLLVNGSAAGSVSYPPTGGWLTGPQQDRLSGVAAVTVRLDAGVQRVKLVKENGFAELDHLSLIPLG